MASIVFKNVTLDYPIYGTQKSFRAALKNIWEPGGLIYQNPDNPQHVHVRALDNMSFSIEDGERVGFIGLNGSGKSTLLRVCARVYKPAYGSVEIRGKVSPLFTTSPGLDFDDTGYENIFTCGLFLGMSHEEIRDKIPEIEEFAELGDYLNLPVRVYSSGMLTRFSFSVATAIDPEILILDEGLGAGDVRFAEKAKQRVHDLIGRSSILLLASHSEALIKSFCSRAIILEQGKIIDDGDIGEICEKYREMHGVSGE